MDIGKSVIISLRDKGKNKKWLAGELSVTQATITTLCKNTTCTGPMLDKLCDVFEAKASEFIALGE